MESKNCACDGELEKVHNPQPWGAKEFLKEIIAFSMDLIDDQWRRSASMLRVFGEKTFPLARQKYQLFSGTMICWDVDFSVGETEETRYEVRSKTPSILSKPEDE